MALAGERWVLIDDFRVDGGQFAFPANGNGSGTPDSQASPRALVQLLTAMARTPVAAGYQAALPGDGGGRFSGPHGDNAARQGTRLAKPGTTIVSGPDGRTFQLKAQNLAGYIDTRSGRKVAYALMVNDAGPIADIETDASAVFEDEGQISSIIYEASGAPSSAARPPTTRAEARRHRP